MHCIPQDTRPLQTAADCNNYLHLCLSLLLNSFKILTPFFASSSFSYALLFGMAQAAHIENIDVHAHVLILRILAIVSSSLSIISGILAFYFWFIIDNSRRVFRHQLIIFLIFFDLLKAISLFIYPIRALTITSIHSAPFCDAIGFLTSTSIEGADLAILTFAIHTALLIFKPESRGNAREGGLYRFRFIVYIASFTIPLIIASLAFINNTGYISITTWCYLPTKPIWYRLVLSWVPRYLIVLIMATIYISIYIHILKEFHVLGNNVNNLHSSQIQITAAQERKEKTPILISILSKLRDNIMFVVRRISAVSKCKNGTACIQSQTFNNINESAGSSSITQLTENSPQILQRTLTTTATNSSNINTNIHNNPSTNEIPDNALALNNYLHSRLRENIHQQTITDFDERRKMIEKQVKSIFIYPLSYVFLWLAPFILQCLQFNYEEKHGPIFWLSCIVAWMQPFNCTIDTLVFLFRETPWNYTSDKIENGLRPRYRVNNQFTPSLGNEPFDLNLTDHEQTINNGDDQDNENPSSAHASESKFFNFKCISNYTLFKNNAADRTRASNKPNFEHFKFKYTNNGYSNDNHQLQQNTIASTANTPSTPTASIGDVNNDPASQNIEIQRRRESSVAISPFTSQHFSKTLNISDSTTKLHPGNYSSDSNYNITLAPHTSTSNNANLSAAETNNSNTTHERTFSSKSNVDSILTNIPQPSLIIKNERRHQHKLQFHADRARRLTVPGILRSTANKNHRQRSYSGGFTVTLPNMTETNESQDHGNDEFEEGQMDLLDFLSMR